MEIRRTKAGWGWGNQNTRPALLQLSVTVQFSYDFNPSKILDPLISEPAVSQNQSGKSITKSRAQVRLASPPGAVGLNTLLTLPGLALLLGQLLEGAQLSRSSVRG